VSLLRALARLEERRYDVMLCDVQMPGLDGPAFYDILRSQYPHLCQWMIFLTGDILSAESMVFWSVQASRGYQSLLLPRQCAVPLHKC
jgi:CheY-like chemotaxis protein